MTEILKPFRKKIDSLDEQLVTLLVEREKTIREVAKVKEKHGIPIILQDRIDEIIEQVTKQAVAEGGSEEYIQKIFKHIIKITCDIENNIMDKGEL